MSHPLSEISTTNLPVTKNDKQPISPEKAQTDFGNLLKGAIDSVNTDQTVANQKAEALASGEIDQLHDVMVASQKAGVTLETSVGVQEKVIDAYNEMMRMQI